MEQRTFGRTGRSVGELGAGVTFFDSALVYVYGHGAGPAAG